MLTTKKFVTKTESHICLLGVVKAPLHPEDVKNKIMGKESLKILILMFCFLYIPTFCALFPEGNKIYMD